MNSTVLLLIGLSLAFIICVLGLIFSFISVKRHTGETDEIHGIMSRRRIIFNPVYLIYILFAIIAALAIGFFAWMFKGAQ